MRSCFSAEWRSRWTRCSWSRTAETHREDSERAVAPLVAAADAVTLDSTQQTLSEVVQRIEALVVARARLRSVKWATDAFAGKRYGKYEVLCRLAVGGMAEIFLAFAHEGPFAGRPVVLKRMLPEQREDPVAVQMLIDEARLTATLNHRHVARSLIWRPMARRCFW